MQQIMDAFMESWNNMVSFVFNALVAVLPIAITILGALIVIELVTKTATKVSNGGGWSSNYNDVNPDFMLYSSENDPDYDWWL